MHMTCQMLPIPRYRWSYMWVDLDGHCRRRWTSFCLFSLLSFSFFLLHIPPLFFTLPLPNLYTLSTLSTNYASLPHCLKKDQKDASAAVRKACSSSSSRSSGDGGGGGIRQELMLKSLSSKLKQKSKETRGIEERY